MHLGYIDDSGTDSASPFVIFGATVIEDKKFSNVEAISGLIMERLIPEHKYSEFKEFHAAEMYHGHGVFEEIDEDERYAAIRRIVQTVSNHELTFIYSAVDKAALRKSAFGSIDPVDMAFRMCCLGIEQWMNENARGGLCLFILDDTTNKSLKDQLKRSFKDLRAKLRPPEWASDTRMWYVHDDMYFGDSVESIGIQITDICAYVLSRKMRHKLDADEFYPYFEGRIICSKVQPEWGKFREIFIDHEQRIPEVRPDNGGTVESSPQRDKEKVGRGESRKEETEKS